MAHFRQLLRNLIFDQGGEQARFSFEVAMD